MVWGCHNRAPLVTHYAVQQGWTEDGRRIMVLVGSPASKECQYTKADDGKDQRCQGCKWRENK